MATPYDVIYNSFLNKAKDYTFLQLPVEVREEILYGWLRSAIVEFKKCKTDLSDRDEILKQFNQDLSEEEIDILSEWLKVKWLNPQLYTIENLKNNLSSKDFNLYSPANLLKEIRETYKQAIKDANRMMVRYTYNNTSLDDVK